MSTVLSFLHQDYITKQLMSHSVQVVYSHCGIFPVFLTHYMNWTDVSKNINYKQYTGDPWNSIIIYYKKWVTTMSSVLPSFYQDYITKQPISDSFQVVYYHCGIWPVFWITTWAEMPARTLITCSTQETHENALLLLKEVNYKNNKQCIVFILSRLHNKTTIWMTLSKLFIIIV